MNQSDPQAQDAALELDRRARQEALDVRRSMLLQAPAGSGKTTVLTARFLALLAAVDAPEEILAITFTRKAAAEMRQRIFAALQAASAGQAVPGIAPSVLQAARERDAACGWNLLRNPSRLRIETIDALNHWLATQLPISARSGPGLEIASSPAPLYRRAARACLQLAAEDRDAAAAAELLFDRLDNSWRRLEQLLADMLERRSHWLPRVLQARGSGLAQRVQASLESALRAELAAAIASVPSVLLREGEGLLTHALRVRAAAGAAVAAPAGAVVLNAEPESLPQWRALCELALTEHGWRQRFTSREGFERDDKAMKSRVAAWIHALERLPGAQQLWRALRALPDHRIEAADHEALEALALLLVRAAAELQLVFAASARVDYSYVAAAAREALSEQGAPSDFALRAGGALRHILVDEFQDTSYEQLALLRALTAGWERGDGRTLFVVGDPMQSIYQFREAEVGLFLQARDHGVGEIRFEALQLRRNFRSGAPLIDWVNTHFSQLFPADDDARRAAIRYLPALPAAVAAHEAAAAVTLHRLHDGDLAAEAERLVEIVRAARARDPAASIAVLVASREHVALPVVQLRAAGFALRGVDLERLRDRPVIRDLAALTRALLHAADRSAWLALLRAPWCGLTLAQLEALTVGADGDMFELLRGLAAQSGEPPAAPAGAVRLRLSRLCGALAPAILGAERGMPLWQRVEHCWLRLAAPAVHRAAVDRLDAHRFIDALALHDDPERLVGEALSELSERLYSGAPPQPGAIELMTVHAAKGLEWDLVILPGLGRRTAVDTDPLLHWIELPGAGADTDLLLAPIRATQQEPRCSLAGYIKRLRRERARLERVRLLYVAATRARSALHLLAALPQPADPDKQPAPRSGSLLSILWPAIGEQFLALTPLPGSPAAGAHATQPPLWRLPASWSIPRPPAAPATQRMRLASPTPDEAPEYSWVGSTARAVGTIVHAELHRLAAATAAATLATAPTPTFDYRAWLAELGVAADERLRAGARVQEALERTLADPRGRWLLSNSHVEARSEWRLTGLHQG
ncbi:MAG TPA: UvrD-helicase domain-containing protein, partial [Steroidobacteraceae bacterium]|nr:UvrD-helicase domain-containing protein [Steroidobacteraceae bacterium]